MRTYRQCFRIDHADRPHPPTAADDAFHLIVAAPHEPRIVEMLLADFFGMHGVIGIDHGDILDATDSREAVTPAQAEIVCPLADAEREIELFKKRVKSAPPRAILMMLSKREDRTGENVLVDIDQLAERLEPLGSRLLFQCQIHPALSSSWLLVVSVSPISPLTDEAAA